MRLPYYELSSKALGNFRQVKDCLADSSLGLPLIELVYLRVSQINGCSFCLKMHAQSLRKAGETDDRIDSLAGWQVSDLYTPKERAALTWAEAVTHIESSYANDEFYEPLKEHFSDQEISDLTFSVSLMNALNRLAISMRQ
ncbi:carboxymuconolactone decarboxylase family protein [Endozoicomonas sp. SM1973]|uniref:Carboxymuconolactone decarboxylase family protein n=1 Tax=Spartinivicinus marinus TaxID=2994442 RepID=A0A853I8Z2_9GAMM|nr:carboxymuconolactone decarboxylase family protein [Spartinivicinus marinus]MCX4027553.1 carboxymuconolactone decarboxylase family protein [Spartinivicinus marinus]NYZ68202.1 carboxymuconolactone decarboxylase family protein [Spartinivicinus marinus]